MAGLNGGVWLCKGPHTKKISVDWEDNFIQVTKCMLCDFCYLYNHTFMSTDDTFTPANKQKF